jgi:dTDP-glucose 4,6-dehydratase
MKLVVITGCLGLIGSHVTRRCLEKGWKVMGIDKMTYASNKWALEEFSKYENFTFLKKDISKLKTLPDCDYVINIAAESHVENSIKDSDIFMKSNVIGVKNLLNIIKEKHENVFKRPIFFHFSTDEVYGDIKTGKHTEEDILKPSNPYSASKAAADMLIIAWARTYGIEYIILRPTNNYGIGQYCEKLIPLSCKILSINKKINLHDKGQPIRNWLHSDDTASAVIKIIESGKINEIYNVAGNLEQKNYDTATKIVKSFHPNIESHKIEEFFNLEHVRKGQDIRYALDDTKLQQLGWKAKKNFDCEIKTIVEFYKSNFKW